MKTILLIGLGRFGRHIAMKLNELNHQVMAIDKDEERVNAVLPFVTNAQIGDSRRSMGLGLALCKSIVNAHGGEIMVTDHLPHGSIFTFSVPAGEVELHE